LSSEIEKRRAENVDAGVIPCRRTRLEPAVTAQLLQLRRRWFFHQPFQTKLFVEETQPAPGHVFATGDGNDAREIAFAEPFDHLRIRLRRNKNVAVSQQKRRIAGKLLGQFRGPAGAVLDDLASIRNVRAPFFAVAEMIFNHRSPPAGNDEHVADPGHDEAGDDVFEDGPALDAEHGLGQLIGEFPHTGAFAGGKNDGFHRKILTTDEHGWTRIKAKYFIPSIRRFSDRASIFP
jgi:hypothetical protein